MSFVSQPDWEGKIVILRYLFDLSLQEQRNYYKEIADALCSITDSQETEHSISFNDFEKLLGYSTNLQIETHLQAFIETLILKDISLAQKTLNTCQRFIGKEERKTVLSWITKWTYSETPEKEHPAYTFLKFIYLKLKKELK